MGHLKEEYLIDSFVKVKDLRVKNMMVHGTSDMYSAFKSFQEKANLNNKILENMKLFEHFDVNYNRVFILGSLDYLRIVLMEENLNKTINASIEQI